MRSDTDITHELRTVHREQIFLAFKIFLFQYIKYTSIVYKCAAHKTEVRIAISHKCESDFDVKLHGIVRCLIKSHSNAHIFCAFYDNSPNFNNH